ncbi:MAG: LysR family transcriptional regulator [bacterium]|nr:LysR family transcriptional regulator [bacterium]
MRAKTTVWIENDAGEVVYGLGRQKILEAIQDCGSIKAAAERLDMSYRGLWGRLKNSEKRLGFALVKSIPGSGKSSGTTLTPAAVALMKRYGKLLQKTRVVTDRTFDATIKELLEESTEG